jgi:hypothetical protein
MQQSEYASININFDSLAEAYGFPLEFNDNSFTDIAKRFFELADKYNFKYTIFVVGKDLENPRNARQVGKWVADGHEIGNHSYSHRRDIGVLSEKDTRDEIEKAHNIILKTTGVRPQGFISPSWASSRWITKTLLELDYLYDTSYHPSWLLYLMDIKNLINHLGDKRMISVIKRKDFHIPILGHRQIFNRHLNGKCIKVLPLPTSSRFRVSCWHTTGFVFGQRFQKILVKDCLRTIKAFYYLIHPADLIGPEDLDPARTLHLERMKVPLKEKVAYLESMLKIILDSGRKIVPMKELAARAN